MIQEQDGVEGSWRDVSRLFDLEKNLTIRKAHKLSADHISPTYGKKMKVSLAAQVLSRRTSIAMKNSSNFLSVHAKDTANILLFFNDLFDFFNSSNLTDCGTRRPALRQLWPTQKEVRLNF